MKKTPLLEKIKLGLRSLFRVIRNAIFLRFQRKIKLNLGAGGTRMSGYANVDSLLLRETDLLVELKRLPLFVKRGTVTHIYASHIFEHFSLQDIRKILKICYALLEKGGELRISVPDLDKIVKMYYNHWEYFHTKGNSPLLGPIYGGQTSRYDFHKTGFNFPWFEMLLEEAGFTDIKEYDAEQFTRQHGIIDSSLHKKPVGEYVSLNIVAKK